MLPVNNPVGYLDCSQRALAAFLAMSCRLSFDSDLARALPPLLPPSFPSTTAAGFFFFLFNFGIAWPVEIATTRAATWFTSSCLLERLGM